MQSKCRNCYSEPAIISTTNTKVCIKCIGKLAETKQNHCESYTIIPSKLCETEDTCWIIDSQTVKLKRNTLILNPLVNPEPDTE